MDARQRKRLSHEMSSILRHRAGDLGLDMDAAGWVRVDELLPHLKVPRAAVDEVVASNNKARFEIRGELIRASQGHSLEGMPVTQEALEASWTEYTADGPIFHGTRIDAIEGIGRDGIMRGDRTHVHLATSPNSRVGKRNNVAVLLTVASERLRQAGYRVFSSQNGVLLTRHVPPGCIVDLMAVVRCSSEELADLRAALGLP